jgi:hypothetical protein
VLHVSCAVIAYFPNVLMLCLMGLDSTQDCTLFDAQFSTTTRLMCFDAYFHDAWMLC